MVPAPALPVITLAEALALLRWPAFRVRLHAVIAGRSPAKPFHTDPSTGAVARPPGREHDLDGGRRWRLVTVGGQAFLARHTDRRDFEYWRISDWPGPPCAFVHTKSLPPTGAVPPFRARALRP